MISELNDDFVKCFSKLPERVKRSARKSYKIWKQNPYHPSLDFKPVHPTKPIYSVRVSIGWRALGVMTDDVIVWFWIGSHSEYNKILKK
ncbi:MAG: hypothetical protein EPN82_08255 [Bacteroidetes bacterium]|nr:MAG: hypothetical protein EPN82_08255 [Bacteroidota bacterium]